MGRIHPFYFYRSRPEERLGISQRRDESAMSEILAALQANGYDRGEPILNFPPPDFGGNLLGAAPRSLDLSFVHEDDIIVQATRPPLDDLDNKGRKMVWPGLTDLEETLFGVWRNWLACCTRYEILLHRDLHHLLKPPFDTRRHMHFRERSGADYRQLHCGMGARAEPTDEKTERRSAAFLLYVKRAWRGGPGYLCAFGMDGLCTEVWAYRLARDFVHLLDKPTFVVAELTSTGVPELPGDMRWANDWGVDIVMQTRPAGVGPRVRRKTPSISKTTSLTHPLRSADPGRA